MATQVETQAEVRIMILADPSASGAEAYHKDFPEIRARGRSPADAAEHLVLQLERTLDSALSPWRRETIFNAMLDARDFALNHS